MVIDLENLLLVGGELRRRAFESCQNSMCLGPQTHTGATLLHCLTGIFNLVDPSLQRAIRVQNGAMVLPMGGRVRVNKSGKETMFRVGVIRSRPVDSK